MALFRHVVQIEPDAIATLANFSDGDARAALNALENVVKSKTRNSSISGFEDEDVSVITVADVKDAMLKSHLQYDRNGKSTSIRNFFCLFVLWIE